MFEAPCICGCLQLLAGTTAKQNKCLFQRAGGNAGLHEIEEYMEKVEEWFRKYEMSHPPVRRKIYLATDEPKVTSVLICRNSKGGTCIKQLMAEC